MSSLHRKLLSALKLLRDSPHPLQDLQYRVQANLLSLRFVLRRDQPLCYRTGAGFPFVCLPESPISRSLFLSGYQEEIESSVVAKWLRPGDACIDVGANVGYFSCLFADRVGTQGRVLALEPGTRTFSWLSETLKLLKLSQVEPICACALDSERPVHFMEAIADEAGCEQSLKIDPNREAEFREVQVPGTTLDNLVEARQCSGRVSVVKIDVEGAEPLVLRGASYLLRGPALPLFLVEIHQLALANFDFAPSDILAHFPTHDFRLFMIPRSISDATPSRQHGVAYAVTDPGQADWPTYCNLLAVPLRGSFTDRDAALRTLLPYGN